MNAQRTRRRRPFTNEIQRTSEIPSGCADSGGPDAGLRVKEEDAHFGVNFTTDPSAKLFASVPSFVQYTLVASTTTFTGPL